VPCIHSTDARNNQPNQCYSSGFSPASMAHVVCSQIRAGWPRDLNQVQYAGRPIHAEGLVRDRPRSQRQHTPADEQQRDTVHEP
jgi:hypothetical protein